MSADENEQFELELINRMRLNPQAELAQLVSSTSPLTAVDPTVQQDLDFFQVNGTLLAQQWGTLQAAPPLAWNDQLAAAATAHSNLMITDQTQSHQLPGEDPFDVRITNAGYPQLSSARESIFAFAKSITEAHAAFAIDWGNGPGTTGGIQNGAGHRANIVAPDVREIGIAVVPGSGTTEPLVITEDYAASFSHTQPEILGVAFQDTAHTGFYLPGEEMAGITVTDGSGTTSTAAAGGWQLTVAPGPQSVTFSGGVLPALLGVALNVSTINIKLDVTGTDAIDSSASVALGGGVHQLRLLGTDHLAAVGNDLGDGITGNGAGDALTGGAADDTFLGNGGANAIDGGGGTNTAIYTGNRADYALSRSGAQILVSGDGSDDTLANIATLLFADGSVPTSSIACFATGARIHTPFGEVPVETLRPGVLVSTPQGPRAVVWIGWRRLDCARHPRPLEVLPVRVAPGAFGEGRPHTGLLLSPDHAVWVGEALVPVRWLLNGASIVQERVAAVTYWHVELARQGILYANGLPAESYLDTGNRAAFEGDLSPPEEAAFAPSLNERSGQQIASLMLRMRRAQC